MDTRGSFRYARIAANLAAEGCEPDRDRGRRAALRLRWLRDPWPGRTGRAGGFTNLKRILGRLADFAFVARELARIVPAGHAVAGCDEGAWALAGAVALTLGVPAVLVRRVPKTYFVSYGEDPAIGGGRLAGERLPPGTPVHLIDDLVFSGQTLRSAREALSAVGLDARTASAIVWTYRADAAMEELSAAGLTEITCLTHQCQIPD
jgi:adenine/guanine phosphoribosyltransferase-like PRPP-binding protein